MPLVRDLSEDEVRDGYTDKDGFHNGAKQILAVSYTHLTLPTNSRG